MTHGDSSKPEIQRDAAIDSALSNFAEKQIAHITELHGEELHEVSVPLWTPFAHESEGTYKLVLVVQQRRQCYYLYAKHDYEAWVAREHRNGPRHNVEKLELHVRRDRDGADYRHSTTNSSYCNKTDKIYFTGNACGLTKVTATATFRGQSWSAGPSIIH